MHRLLRLRTSSSITGLRIIPRLQIPIVPIRVLSLQAPKQENKDGGTDGGNPVESLFFAGYGVGMVGGFATQAYLGGDLLENVMAGLAGGLIVVSSPVWIPLAVVGYSVAGIAEMVFK